ncbi:uncharacterized protein PAC_15213 [Phialocephala subalpina]|uniref:Uncharacterized protein n=1 Tax=Phialocephala subalpina TaxID=576137 RepID=A0A1L7XJX7_9HELO|nr:uncharacterized protein PAC_15213 [Phialocephala subalpina]
MEWLNVLYVFYLAKVAVQSYVYFASLKNPPTATITYATASVAVLSVVALFHVIVHTTKKAPLSDPAVIIYLCLSYVLAFLWHEPTRAAANGILSFALVTTSDLLILILFCLHNLVLLLRNKQNKDPEVAEVRSAPAELSRGAEQRLRHEPPPTEPVAPAEPQRSISPRQDATPPSLGPGRSFESNFAHRGTPPRVASSFGSFGSFGAVAEASTIDVQRTPGSVVLMHDSRRTRVSGKESEDRAPPASHGMTHDIRLGEVVSPTTVRTIALPNVHPLHRAEYGQFDSWFDPPSPIPSPAESRASERTITLARGDGAVGNMF